MRKKSHMKSQVKLPTQVQRRKFLAYTLGMVLISSSVLWANSSANAQSNPNILTEAKRPSHAELYKALQDGGLVIYFRHGRTNKGGVDNIEWPREQQRLLSEQGEAQSRRIGEAFKHHGFAVGEVLSSPFARCHDMAVIAFGKTQDKMELLGILSESSGRDARAEYSIKLVNQAVPLGQNRIIVGHSSNIRESTGESVGEGDAVVLRPSTKGTQVLAVLSPEDWDALQ